MKKEYIMRTAVKQCRCKTCCKPSHLIPFSKPTEDESEHNIIQDNQHNEGTHHPKTTLQGAMETTVKVCAIAWQGPLGLQR